MHEKLVKQLRNINHCYECPYDKDCDEFDSCLMDLLAADAIEDMSKRIAGQEKELQEYYKLVESKSETGFWTSEQWNSWTEDAKRRLFEPYALKGKDAILNIDLVASQFGAKDKR